MTEQTTENDLELPSVPVKRRGRSSAFAVYASFVISEFSNLEQAPGSPLQMNRGRELCSTIRRQLEQSDKANESIWRQTSDTYEEVFELDRLNLRLMNLNQLRLRAFALLERYRTLFSGEELARITRVVHGVDSANPSSEQEIRSQTDEVLASMHWYLLFSRARDRRIYELMKLAIFMLVILTACAMGCLITKINYLDSSEGSIASFLVFLIMGGLGAATSVSWRLQSLLVSPPTLPETHLTDLAGLKYGGQGLIVSIGCGVVFSFILYMIFIGNFFRGPLFPIISTIETAYKEGMPLNKFFSCTGPKDGFEYAKLLVWLFISGFAEKFVPDVLDRIRKGPLPKRDVK